MTWERERERERRGERVWNLTESWIVRHRRGNTRHRIMKLIVSLTGRRRKLYEKREERERRQREVSIIRRVNEIERGERETERGEREKERDNIHTDGERKRERERERGREKKKKKKKEKREREREREREHTCPAALKNEGTEGTEGRFIEGRGSIFVNPCSNRDILPTFISLSLALSLSISCC